MSKPKVNAWEYWKRVGENAWRTVAKDKSEAVVFSVLGGIAAFAFAWVMLGKQAAIENEKLVFASLAGGGVGFILLLIYKFWQTPAEMEHASESNHARKHADNQTTIDASQEQIDYLRSVAPEIDIQFGTFVLKGELGKKPTHLFVFVYLTLQKPREVRIDSFALKSITPQEVPIPALWIDDINDWVRVLDSDGEAAYTAVICTNTKFLGQRGDPVLVTVHFSLDMSESEIQRSMLLFSVNTPNGTCSQTKEGTYIHIDRKINGMMMKKDSSFVKSLWPGLSGSG